MSVGTAFHPRTAPLNRKMEWREWSGYFAASVYADAPDIEYNAIREAAALIDVTPLFKYRVTGPDSMRLIDRIITRDATRLQIDQVYYACWCDDRGKVIDDGTITRLDETTYRWTAADPSLRWFRLNSRGLEVEIDEITEATAAVALQGPLSRDVLQDATDEDLTGLKYFRRRPSAVRGIPVDVTRTGYTGDLGYELWVDSDRAVELWDALMEAGRAYEIRPAGMLALDVVRVEAGLILLEADYTSSRHALIPEQAYSPFELGVLGTFTKFDKGEYVGRRALLAEQAAGGPARRLVGLAIDWDGIERLFAAQDLPPVLSPLTSGRATSTTWSPTLKKAIALASVEKEHAAAGTRLDVEWTVEARRGRAPATVVELPFFDPPRKRA
ncbi:MAG: aminomethyl transferase family protein [Actinobacteria bacterium]|nr:MAG: aminomethyl transferase family protein [Actinomycetota bacterium]